MSATPRPDKSSIALTPESDAVTIEPERPRELPRVVTETGTETARRQAPEFRRRSGESDSLGEVRIRERNFRRGLAVADMVAAEIAVFVAINVIGGDRLQPAHLLILPVIVLVAKLQGLYDRDELRLRKSTLDELPQLFNLATLFALLVFLARHGLVRGAPGTGELLSMWLLLIASLPVCRYIARAVALAISPIERCLVLGDAANLRRLRGKVEDRRRLEIMGFVPIEHVREPEVLQALVRQERVQRIIVAPSHTVSDDETVELVRTAKATGVRVSLLPSILGAVGSSVVFDDLGGITLLGVRRFGLSHSSALVKRGFDVVSAFIALVLFLPFLGVVSVVIKLGSPGPVFFRQSRVGRDGTPFMMLKLRTMIDGAEELKADLAGLNEASGLFKIYDDPRLTTVGRQLRRSHLDEVPQLINVLRGEMSLVGPRPLVVDEDERITGLDRRRLQLTPGMTGQWQIMGSARIPLSEMVKLDYLYVANWSLWGDVKILIRTLRVVLGRRGQ